MGHTVVLFDSMSEMIALTDKWIPCDTIGPHAIALKNLQKWFICHYISCCFACNCNGMIAAKLLHRVCCLCDCNIIKVYILLMVKILFTKFAFPLNSDCHCSMFIEMSPSSQRSQVVLSDMWLFFFYGIMYEKIHSVIHVCDWHHADLWNILSTDQYSLEIISFGRKYHWRCCDSCWYPHRETYSWQKSNHKNSVILHFSLFHQLLAEL